MLDLWAEKTGCFFQANTFCLCVELKRLHTCPPTDTKKKKEAPGISVYSFIGCIFLINHRVRFHWDLKKLQFCFEMQFGGGKGGKLLLNVFLTFYIFFEMKLTMEFCITVCAA